MALLTSLDSEDNGKPLLQKKSVSIVHRHNKQNTQRNLGIPGSLETLQNIKQILTDKTQTNVYKIDAKLHNLPYKCVLKRFKCRYLKSTVHFKDQQRPLLGTFVFDSLLSGI